MDLVIGLQALGREDLSVAGAKGANLGELLQAGMPVPPGFVATTAAYDRVVAHAGLAPVIAEAVAAGDVPGGGTASGPANGPATGGGSAAEPSDAGAAVRRAFEGVAIAQDVESALRSSYSALGAPPVAVRSSATTEDLPGAAFAGQQETFLNVVGERQLLDAVRGCWASLWSERAIAYRKRLGLHREDVKIAVVVQVMAPADVAGVLFTGDPVTGDRGLTVIDAGAGLGEAVVSGLVTPEHYAVRRSRWWPGGWTVVERRPGRQELIVRGRPGGGTERVAADEPHPGRPLLATPTLRRLARIGAAIETHFGAPQDVEWAVAGGRLSVLQARPITAMAPPPPTQNRIARTIAALIAELVPERPYPLEATSWGPELVLSAVLGPMFRQLGVTVRFDRLFVEDDGVLVRLRSRLPIRPTLAVVLAPGRLLTVAVRHAPARWREDPLLATALRTARELEARDLGTLSLAGLLALVREAMALPVWIGALRARYAPRALLAAAQLFATLTLLGRRDLLPTLLFAGVETKTLEANRGLEALAARVRTDPRLAEAFAATRPERLPEELRRSAEGLAFLSAFDAFLESFGHRETGSTLQASRPTWRDAPEAVLAIVAGKAKAEAALGTEPFARARAEVLSQPVLRFPWMARAFDGLLGRARRFAELREDTRFYATLALPVIRRALLEMGHRLAAEGVLDEPEDVFHVKLSELAAFAARRGDGAQTLRGLVATRRAKRAALVGTPMVDPRYFVRGDRDASALVTGSPGSPGTAEGQVRVVMSAADFGSLLPGEVLVAPFTNPAWTPLFQHAAAVVVDSGGAASHAAIVAREYAIPAVMGTVDGTRRLTSGQRVVVDGSTGTVHAVGGPTATPSDAPEDGGSVGRG